MRNRLKKCFGVICILCAAIITSASSAPHMPTWNDIYHKPTPIAKGWKYIVIHHSATHAGNAASFHTFHTDQGYGGLCYHFVIGNGNGSGDGQVEEGFRWKEQIAGTHVAVGSWYHNIFGIGICLVGNFETSAPTEKQMAALSTLIKRLSKTYRIPAENIIGHRSVQVGEIDWDANRINVSYINGKLAPTVCPGKKLSIERLKKKVFGEGTHVSKFSRHRTQPRGILSLNRPDQLLRVPKTEMCDIE